MQPVWPLWPPLRKQTIPRRFFYLPLGKLDFSVSVCSPSGRATLITAWKVDFFLSVTLTFRLFAASLATLVASWKAAGMGNKNGNKAFRQELAFAAAPFTTATASVYGLSLAQLLGLQLLHVDDERGGGREEEGKEVEGMEVEEKEKEKGGGEEAIEELEQQKQEGDEGVIEEMEEMEKRQGRGSWQGNGWAEEGTENDATKEAKAPEVWSDTTGWVWQVCACACILWMCACVCVCA